MKLLKPLLVNLLVLLVILVVFEVSQIVTWNIAAQQSTLREPVITLRAPPAGVDAAPMVQHAIDALAQVTGISSGVGGGEIDCGPGTYLLLTNIVIPNYFPFCLRLKGAGFNGTIFEGRGGDACTNTALFSCATNHILGLSLTNALTLFVSDVGFCHTNQTQTNFLWDITGQTFAKFQDCMFTTKYALVNGNGGYSLNYEGNVPNVPIGLVGLAVSKSGDNANAQMYLEHCLFYGLANGVLTSPVIGRIHNSYFADCGIYFDGATRFMHTNLWRGAAVNYRGQLSSGAAIVIGSGDINMRVTDNVFFNCGALAAVGLDGQVPSGGHITKFRDNYFVAETPTYRFLLADTMSVNCWEDIEGVDFVGGIFTQPDSLCTNGPAGNPVVQPNGTLPTIPVPTLRLVHSGTALDADSYFLFDGSGGAAPRMIGNGSGLTNVIGQAWSGTSGNVTIPAGTYFFPPNNTSSNCVSFTADASAGTRMLVTRGCTVRNFYTIQSAAGGSGKHYTYTVMKNGVATTIVADSNNATSASDTTHLAAFAAGDEIGIKLVVDAAATAAKVSWSLEAK